MSHFSSIVLINAAILILVSVEGSLSSKSNLGALGDFHVNFLGKLITNHLSHCSTFYIGVKNNKNEDNPHLNEIVQGNLDSIKLKFAPESLPPATTSRILMLGPPLATVIGNDTLSMFEAGTPGFQNFLPAPTFTQQVWRKTVKKYTHFCTTVIFIGDKMAATGPSEEMVEFIEDEIEREHKGKGPLYGRGFLSKCGLHLIINPRFYPLIKKNEDYFIFIGSHQLEKDQNSLNDNTVKNEQVQKALGNMEWNLAPLLISHSLLFLLVIGNGGRSENKKQNGRQVSLTTMTNRVQLIVKRNCLLCDDGPNSFLASPTLFGFTGQVSRAPNFGEVGAVQRLQNFSETNFEKISPATDEPNWNWTSLDSFFPTTVMNLRGRLLKVSVTTGIPSRISLVKIEDESRDPYGRHYLIGRGMYAYAVRAFEKKFNFTSLPFPGSPRGVSRAGGSGNLQKDGTWSGVIGDVFNFRADFGFLCGETVGRYTYTELAGAIEFIFLTFTTGKPSPLYDWKAIFWPFSVQVWICCCFAFLLGAVAIYGTQKIENGDNKKTATYVSTGRGTIRVTSNDTFLDSLEFVIFAFFEAPTDMRGVGLIKVQLITAFWCLLGLVMATVYRGILVGLLAFPVIPPLPRNFVELAASDYKVGLQHYGGSAYEQIVNSPNPALIKIKQTMILEPSPYKCYKMVHDQKFGCIDYGTFGDYTILLNFTDHGGWSHLITQPTRDYFLPVGPMFRRRSYLMETFRWAIGKVFDAGLTDKWIKMDYEDVRRQKVLEEKLADPHAGGRRGGGKEVILLTLKNFKGAYTIFFLGLGGGLGLFLGEAATKLFILPALKKWRKKFKKRRGSANSQGSTVTSSTVVTNLDELRPPSTSKRGHSATRFGGDGGDSQNSLSKSMFANPIEMNNP